jgi:hypothetical protein
VNDPAVTIDVMDADADRSEAGRAMNAVRWSPAGRLRSAVDYAAEHAAEMDAAQRRKLEDAITTGGEDSDV